MNNSFRDILLKVLKIIGYADNKDAFVDDFLKNIQLQSVIDLVESLPQDKQLEIKNHLSKIQNDESKASSLLQSYFTKEQIQEALKTTAKNTMKEYAKTINPTLSSAQRDGLISLSQQLNPQA